MAEDWRESAVDADWRETAWRWVGVTRVPRLSRIPREHWREVLIPLSAITRDYAVYDHHLSGAQILEAKALAESLPPPPSEVVRLLGSKPTQVARMLINAGVRRLLAEYDITVDGVTSKP